MKGEKDSVVDHAYVYKNQARKYDALISKQPDLLQVVEEIRPVKNLDVIDLGAGTGRLTNVLAPYAKSVRAFDESPEMLRVNEEKLKRKGLRNWRTEVADIRKIPAADHSADLVVAGWAVSYVAHSSAPDFRQNIEMMIREMKRVLRDGGTMIIFETLGTGYSAPHPPDILKAYYALLEYHYGFKHKWLRMDYQFENVVEAQELTTFFFGDEVSNRVVREDLDQVPECAGVWWLTK